MLTRKDLSSYRQITGFTLGQIEKDYLRHIFLSILYRAVKDELVFKGGTALQKSYGLNRFSEDLDFTLHADIDIEKVVHKSLTGLNIFGCESTKRKKKDVAHGWTYVIKIKGPLFTGAEHSNAFIRLEISKREQVILPVMIHTITPLYTDLPPYSVSVMNPSEIMAEKIRAILTRNKARDIYDLWFLIQKQITTTTQLINKKLQYYNLVFDFESLKKSIEQKEKLWAKEMELLIPLKLKFTDITQSIFSQKFIEE